MMTTAAKTAGTAKKENTRKRIRTGVLNLVIVIIAALLLIGIVTVINGEKMTERPQTHAQALVPTEADIHTTEGTEAAETAKNAPTGASEEQTPAVAFVPDPEEVEALAKVVYREARGCSKIEQAAVIWCILNRVDSLERYFPDTILEVIRQPHQFAYTDETPLWPSLKALAEDVLTRWHNEKEGAENVGRVLPAGYLYFTGDGRSNHFTIEYRGKDTWDWSLPNPYENE